MFKGGDRGNGGSHASVTFEAMVSVLEMDQMVITAGMEVRMETKWGQRGAGKEAVFVAAARWAGATLRVPERWPSHPRWAAPPTQTERPHPLRRSGPAHLRATPPTLEEWPRPPLDERPRPPGNGGPTHSENGPAHPEGRTCPPLEERDQVRIRSVRAPCKSGPAHSGGRPRPPWKSGPAHLRGRPHRVAPPTSWRVAPPTS